MKGNWDFRELKPGEKDRQPTQGEFFATDAISSAAEALVRESIQNSLDAHPEDIKSPIRVRFFIGTGEHALSSAKAKRYFADAWDHFTAKGNGLDCPPKDDESCSYLAVEDFGTTGLTGDIQQWQHIPDSKNPFYYFFRTEGRSGKSEESRGRWGVGKYVFPRSSRINALIALTVRNDDKQRFLMGQAVLKSHRVGENYYTPDGNYGCMSGNGLVLPIDEKASLDQFCEDFKLLRKEDPGLSVVVPWMDKEITADILIRAVIKGYFHPILAGELIVVVATGDKEFEINESSIEATCRELGGEIAEQLLPVIQLSTWARGIENSSLIKLNPANSQRPEWEAALIPNELLPEIRRKFRAGERIGVEVPLTVRTHGLPDRASFFHFYLVNDGGEGGRPIFIRNDIIIPDVHARWMPGVHAIVVIEHSAIAELLGDSENPAHTQWQKEREHFRHKYIYGKSYIEFVTHCISMFVRFLNAADQQADRNLLREIFSIPKKQESEHPKEKSRPRKRNKGEIIVDPPVIETRKQRFSLVKIAGGFTVTRGISDIPMPTSMKIDVAYDRRKGNPLKKYMPADFKIGSSPIHIDTDAVTVVRQELNQIEIQIIKPDFRVTVSGFDENRDLFVSVGIKDVENDS